MWNEMKKKRQEMSKQVKKNSKKTWYSHTLVAHHTHTHTQIGQTTCCTLND